MSGPVEVSQNGPVLEVLLNRKHRRNAIDRAMSEGIAAAMDRLDDTDELRVGILHGAGNTFCSGMDLKAFVDGERPTVPGRGFAGLVEALPHTPLIAAVEGYALAGGLELMLCCDLVVAASDSWFGLPEVTRGLIASGGGLLRLPQRIPRSVAMDLVLTGRRMPAEEAFGWGLVNRLVAPGEALAAARELAAEIAANAPMAVQASKHVIDNVALWPPESRFERQREVATVVAKSGDAREGALAFAERRAPRWTGR